MTLKGGLAFFLITVSGSMVFMWMLSVFLLGATVDAGMAALLASFVTMFIKMAADASGYQYTSSAGSDKKDDNNAEVSKKLAEKAAGNGDGTPWWSLLTDTEKAAVIAAKDADPRVQLFKSTAEAGRATERDLAYLVKQGLLTPERADEIQSS